MKPRQTLEGFQIENIADILANCHDWYAENLALEVDTVLASQLPSLSPEIRSKVVKSFFEVPLEDRISPYFDHKEFVSSVCVSV